MAPDTQNRKSYSNSKTISRGFRISHTLNSLLDREQSSQSGRASAIVRALLTLYFNKRIVGVESLVDAELKKASQAELERIEKLRVRMRKYGADQRNRSF